MGIFAKIFGPREKLPSTLHPIFGQMDATIDHGNGTFFWETPEGAVTPKGTIGVFMDAPADGPTANQLALWNYIYENSESLSGKAEALVRDRLTDFGLEDRYTELEWTAVGIYTDGDRTGPWDMSFQLSSGSPIFTAYFEDETPKHVTVDS